jgi:short-subunit dehydrogenase
MSGPTVIVTGASSGIGRALALAWGKRGADVVLSGRSAPALEEVADALKRCGSRAFVHSGDVTLEADRIALIETARSSTGRLDVLVNCAGQGYYGSVSQIDPDELAALLALNVVAPLRLAQLAIDPLTRTSGCIVMISSIAGLVAAPRIGAYAASKFALEALSMALRAELRGAGIRVLVVRPGPVDTPFRANSITTDGVAGLRPRAARVQSPEEVAEQTLAAVASGRAVVETTTFVRLASAAARMSPGLLRWVSGRLLR